MVTLSVVGGGKMGEALVGGLLAAGWARPAEMAVIEPDAERRGALAAQFTGIEVHGEPVPTEAAIVAVKPQYVPEVCRNLTTTGVRRVLSIAAGVRIATIEAALGSSVAVVRAMPNTPALVGFGASAIAPGAAAGEDDLAWASSILGAVGSVTVVDEAQLDAVTGLSGSGPAYFFLVVEALIDAGVQQGLTRTMASDLAIGTMRGAAELLGAGDSPAELRAAVTSPGGTTAAGLRALESASVRAAFADAVAAAADRSRELG